MQHRVNGFWGESHGRLTTVLRGLALVLALTSPVRKSGRGTAGAREKANVGAASPMATGV